MIDLAALLKLRQSSFDADLVAENYPPSILPGTGKG